MSRSGAHLRYPFEDLAGIMAALVDGIEERFGTVLRLDRCLYHTGIVKQSLRGFRGFLIAVVAVEPVVQVHPGRVLMSRDAAVRLALGVTVLEYLMMMMIPIERIRLLGTAVVPRCVLQVLALRPLIDIVLRLGYQRLLTVILVTVDFSARR